MASPENTNPAPKSPVVQESPVFTYLSSLSPLKLVDSRPGTQPFGDTSCPAPEPVFTSPHFTRPRESSLLNRLSGAEKFPPGYDDRPATVFPENTAITPPLAQLVKSVPCVLSDDGSLQEQTGSSPSTSVDAFLADPSEICDDSSGSPEHCVKRQGMCREDDLVQAQPRTSDDTEERSTSTGLPDLNSDEASPLEETLADITVPDVKTCITTKAAVSLCSSYQADEDPAEEEPYVLVNLVGSESSVKMVDKAVEVNERSLDAELKLASNNVSVNADSSTLPASGTQLEWSLADQDPMDHPSFMSKDSDVYPGKENPNNSIFCCHGTKDGKVHHAKTVQCGGLNCTPQLWPESLQNIRAGDNHPDRSGAMSSTSAENHIPYDQEDGAQHQRGMRKRLQFEAVENCKMNAGYETNSWIFTTNVSNVESPVTSLEMEPVNASNKESIATSSNNQLIQSVSGNALCRFSCKVDSSVQNKGSPPVTVPRTFGIGLHLNSIGGPIDINVNMQLSENGLGERGEKLLSGGNDQVPQYPKDHLASRSSIGCHSVKLSTSSDNFSPYSATENSEEKQQENQAIKASNSIYQSSLDSKPQSSSLQLKPIDRYMTPCSMKRQPSEDASRTESTQRSPKKKKQMKKAPESDGCKRCNCKRSKCLKLYCDCFAAGVFCSEACACQECYNKPEHENTVHETRQQIESRNPLAFAPKVVVRATNPPKDTGDTEHVTPTSARHKRGCNCKKSLCLKKYCECFQAGVGCSLGCRCEGCRNTFGRKDGGEITEIEHEKYKERGLERDPSVEHLGGIEVKKGLVNIEHCYSRLTPLTPLFQGSNENDVAKSQLPAKYYPSPESGASVSPSYEDSPSSPMDSISSNTFAKETEGTSSLVPYNQELGCHTAVQVDPFSPGWDRFPDICNFSPLPNPSPRVCGAAANASKAREPKTLHAKLFQGGGRLSVGSLRWRSSPVTPLPQLGEGKLVIEPDSDSGLRNNHEDDTPEILMDTCSPIKVVKASSPNQKRVSPPHKHLNEMRPSSSPALRNGRKFILQSVPSFPPLTPYSNNTRGQGT